MSIYSSVGMDQKEALLQIAKELDVEIPHDPSVNNLIAAILFSLTSKNENSEYHWNNFWVYPSDVD